MQLHDQRHERQTGSKGREDIDPFRHALHNAWRVCEVLPRKFTEPVPYVANREEFRYKMARKLQKSNPQKRAKTKGKAKDAREQKKRKVELVEGTQDEQSGDEEQLPVA